jgi:hypothetical protein
MGVSLWLSRFGCTFVIILTKFTLYMQAFSVFFCSLLLVFCFNLRFGFNKQCKKPSRLGEPYLKNNNEFARIYYPKVIHM